MGKLLFDWSNDNAVLMLQITFFFSVMSFIMCLILFYKRHKDEVKSAAIGKRTYTENDEYNPFEDGVPVSEETLTAKPTSSPYCITIKNTTNEVKSCNLFGLGQNIFRKNFGSDEGVTVSMGVSYVDYLFMLIQSAFQPFETGLIRLMSKNTKQLEEIITITSKDANGQMCQIPIITANYIKPDGIGMFVDEEGNKLLEDDYKNLNIYYVVRIDVSTDLDLKILPNTELQIYLFPVNKFNASRGLGRPSVKEYCSPKKN